MFGAEEPGGAGLVHRVLHPAQRMHGLAADVDRAERCLDRVRGDDAALDQRVRIRHHQRNVLAGARFSLVGVDHQVARLGAGRRQERPLQAGRETGAATTAQPGVLDQLGDPAGDDTQGERQCLVAVELPVGADRPGLRRRPTPGQHRGQRRSAVGRGRPAVDAGRFRSDGGLDGDRNRAGRLAGPGRAQRAGSDLRRRDPAERAVTDRVVADRPDGQRLVGLRRIGWSAHGRLLTSFRAAAGTRPSSAWWAPAGRCARPARSRATSAPMRSGCPPDWADR